MAGIERDLLPAIRGMIQIDRDLQQQGVSMHYVCYVDRH